MNRGGVYRVTGTLGFRGHKPGETFEAVLDPRAEARAIARGNIRRIRTSTPQIRPGSYNLPPGWTDSTREV